MSAIYPFFQWASETWIASVIRNSRYVFPLLEMFHLFALTILLGLTLILSLRLLGVFLEEHPVAELAHEFSPWMSWSIVVILLSGTLMFSPGALRYFDNTSFRVKMLLLFSALLFQFTILPRVARSEDSGSSSPKAKLTGIAALVLWFGVGLAGRGIGFVG